MLVLFILDSPQFFDSDYDASHKRDDPASVYDEGPAFSDQGEARQDMRRKKVGGAASSKWTQRPPTAHATGFSLRESR
jgi:hypothetical protein